MKSGVVSMTKYRILLAIVSILLVLSSCLFVAGSWFTYNQNVTGNFTMPTYTITIDSNEDPEPATLYYTFDSSSYSTDLASKSIAISVSTNLTINNIMRAWVTFDWGRMEDDTFISDSDPDYGVLEPLSNTLVPTYSNTWTGSVESSNSNYSYYDSTQPTYYYYNSYVQTTNSAITLFSGITFNGDSSLASMYDGKTVMISVYVEMKPAVEVADWIVPNNDTEYEYGEYAPSTWPLAPQS